MKKIYSITILLLFAITVIGQNRIYPPNLRAPVDGEGNMSPNVTLDWDAVTGQTTDITYEVQLATQADFSDAITFDKTDVTAMDMTELKFGETYYWRVKAYDAEDPSEWSEMWTFTVVSTVKITKPTIAKKVYATQTIEWDDITGLTKYQLQVDTTYEWNAENAVTENDVLGTFVFDENNMWLVGEGGLIQYFNGTEWTVMDAGTTEDLNAVTFIDSSNGYAVGEGGIVLNYNGADWTTIDAGVTDNLTSVSFVDAENGWAVGDGGLLLTYSGGSWSNSTESGENLTGVFAISTTNVWACGEGEVVLHYNGTEWSSEVVGNRDHSAIVFVDANNGWVVSKSGKIHYYNGTEWMEETSGTNKNLLDVGFDGMMGYVVGDDGTMLNYNGDWRLVASGSDENLHAVDIAGDAGLIGGEAGAVVVKSATGFNSPFLHTYNVNADSSQFELNNLLFGKSIYYRMRAMHSNDTSSWAGGRSMITYAAPELDKPSNGSSNTDLMLTFEWDEYEGSTEYTFQISSTEDFAEPVISFSDTASTHFSMKYFGQDYFWRVNALHAEDVSDWSETWSVTTISEVELSDPEDGEEDVSSCPSYEWEEIVGVTSYEIYVDKNSDFSNPSTDITEDPSYQCTSPLDKNTVYYWKVRAISSLDTSAWSTTYSFKIEGYAGIGDEFTSGSVDIYPNPTSDNVNLSINSFASDLYYISITDITGKMIYQEEIECKSGENNVNINMGDARKGIYLVNIRKQDKTITKKLFVK